MSNISSVNHSGDLEFKLSNSASGVWSSAPFAIRLGYLVRFKTDNKKGKDARKEKNRFKETDRIPVNESTALDVISNVSFQLRVGEKSVQFRCPNEVEAKRWVTALLQLSALKISETSTKRVSTHSFLKRNTNKE